MNIPQGQLTTLTGDEIDYSKGEEAKVGFLDKFVKVNKLVFLQMLSPVISRMVWEYWQPWGTTKTLWTRLRTNLLWPSWKRVWIREPDRDISTSHVPSSDFQPLCLPLPNSFHLNAIRVSSSQYLACDILPSALLNQNPSFGLMSHEQPYKTREKLFCCHWIELLMAHNIPHKHILSPNKV